MQKTLIVNTQQASYIVQILFLATNPTLSQTITAETQMCQILMEELNKVNQDKKLLKKANKRKAQQNQILLAKVVQQN